MDNRHDQGYYDEEDNICNMKELGTIEVYKSEKTGKIYFTFIVFDNEQYNGEWFDTKEVFPEEWNKLKTALFKIIDEED